MSKTKKAGRPCVWPKGSLKPLNLGQMPKHLHPEIKAFAKAKKAQSLEVLKSKEVANA